MIYIQGELFRNIPETNYFDGHSADFSKINRNKVVTHNSDYSTSQILELNNNKEIFYMGNFVWFAQNVDIYHPRIIPIPIGLENSEWFPHLNKLEKIKNIDKSNKHIFCTACFNPTTHPSRTKTLATFMKSDFCKTMLSVNGTWFDLYLRELAASSFAICPRGNGIDTHRLWEALYCNTIPVVEDCVNIRGFDLPMVIVKDYASVTKELLEKELAEIPNRQYNMDQLDMNYWINYIQSYEN